MTRTGESSRPVAPPGSVDATDLPWQWQDSLVIALAALATVVAMFQLWRPGVPGPVDLVAGIYRAFELEQSVRGGVLYPRMGMGLNFGYGGPLFEFYAPLASYATLLAHWTGAGWVEASKLVLAVALFAGGVGAYVYGRRLFGSRPAGVVSGAAFVFAPYILCNSYQRGAIAESVALCLVPWLFWCFHRILSSEDRAWVFPAAGVLALLILAHNITALFVTAFLGIYLGWQILAGRAWGRLPSLALAMALGLAASSFFWLPAMAERGFTVVDTVLTSGMLDVGGNLAPWTGLVQPWLAFDYYGDLRFRVALLQVAIGLAATLMLPLQTGRLRSLLAPLALMAAVMMVLETSSSAAFWETVPLVRYIQFPWRLSGLVSFAVAMLAGSLVGSVRMPAVTRNATAIGLIALIVATGMWNLAPDKSPFWYPYSSAEVGRADEYYRGTLGFPVYADQMPIWVSEASRDLASPDRPGAAGAPVSGSVPGIVPLEETLTSVVMKVRAEAPGSLKLHSFYYPGWSAWADGVSVPVRPSGPLGLVTVDVPAGGYTLRVAFEETPLRLATDAVSLLGVAVLLAGLAWSLDRRRALALIVLAALVALGTVWYAATAGVRRPSPVQASLGNEIRLVGYHAASPEVRAGSSYKIRLYWFVQRAPSDDYKVFLHVIRPGDPAQVAQGDAEPFLGYGPTTRWEPGELVADDYEVELDPGLPAGEYQVLVGMYRPDTMENLTVTGAAQVLPGERVVLTSLRVMK